MVGLFVLYCFHLDSALTVFWQLSGFFFLFCFFVLDEESMFM